VSNLFAEHVPFREDVPAPRDEPAAMTLHDRERPKPVVLHLEHPFVVIQRFACCTNSIGSMVGSFMGGR